MSNQYRVLLLSATLVFLGLVAPTVKADTITFNNVIQTTYGPDAVICLPKDLYSPRMGTCTLMSPSASLMRLSGAFRLLHLTTQSMPAHMMG